MEKFKVTFLPDNKSVVVEKDKTILAAAILAGIYLNSACASQGSCGKCKVIVNNKTCLACLKKIKSELEVVIPDTSRLKLDNLSLEEFESIQLPEKKFFDNFFGFLRQKKFGLCFDIGTTTISGQLINLNSKKILGTKTAYNRQVAFGSDVITRIVYAAKPKGLAQLHSCVCNTINQIIKELTFEYKINFNDIKDIAFAGNTTMIYLLLNKNPEQIRKEPYAVTANSLPIVSAVEAGININPKTKLYSVPGVSSYIGGDATAGVLSSLIYQQETPCILIDIGTNGEIVLGNKEFLLGCAASAGPAFEGSGLTCGMRASLGAIQRVSINKTDFSLKYSTIGDKKPIGICGSGYIDLLCEMLEAGIIDKSGKIIVAGKRIRKSDSGLEFVVCFKEENGSDADIVITQADIENLKRSKGAIYSAVSILVKHLGLSFSAIDKIYISGGFGTYLDIDKAIRIGLLPDIQRAKFIFIGNSSLAGSRLVLLSAKSKQLAEEIASKITHFELSTEAKYMDEYSRALFFPHTDLEKFPTVKF